MQFDNQRVLLHSGNVCEFGKPQMYGGKEVFCGRGPNRQDCADGYKCKIDPTDRYAVCCPVRRELSLIFSSTRRGRSAVRTPHF